jgi:peptide/nickel transport system permease protein
LLYLEVGRVGFIFQQQMNSLSKSSTIESGKMVGNSSFGLMRRYYIPFILPAIITNFTLELGRVLLIVGQLGVFYIYILSELVEFNPNVFVHINTSLDWATLMAESRSFIRTPHVWTVFFPALAITDTVNSFNLLGEGLRKHLEQSSSKKYSLS